MGTRGWGAWATGVAAAAWWTGLWVAPEGSLKIWWGGVVPVLPALFLVAPKAWRNVCPVAALEIAAGRRSGRVLDAADSVRMGGLGAVLFASMVPARPLLLDHHAPALAGLLAAVALVAVLRGRTHAVRAGFCNAFCPLGPLERLYGQRAMIDVAPTHCPSCSACTRRGCLDVAGDKAFRQLVGAPRRASWLKRPQGVLAAAMPGFVIGYAAIGAVPTWSRAYAAVALGGLVSVALTATAAFLVRESSRRVPPVLAALSALGFYQLVAPASVAGWDVPWLDASVRWAGTAVVVVWAARTGRRTAPAPVVTLSAPSGGRALPVLSTQPG